MKDYKKPKNYLKKPLLENSTINWRYELAFFFKKKTSVYTNIIIWFRHVVYQYQSLRQQGPLCEHVLVRAHLSSTGEPILKWRRTL